MVLIEAPLRAKPQPVAVQPVAVPQPAAHAKDTPVTEHPLTSAPVISRQQSVVSADAADNDAAESDLVPQQAQATAAPSQEENQLAVRQHLERFKYYPASARRRGIEGVVEVSFDLDGEGRASTLQVTEGSGYSVLDQAALQTVRRAEPFPVSGGSYRFRLLFRRS